MAAMPVAAWCGGRHVRARCGVGAALPPSAFDRGEGGVEPVAPVARTGAEPGLVRSGSAPLSCVSCPGRRWEGHREGHSHDPTLRSNTRSRAVKVNR